MILISLAGPKGVGKSSVARELKKLLPNSSIMSFADPIRAALSAMGIEEPATQSN